MISLFCIFVGILSCYLIFPPTATAQTPEPNEPVSTDNLVLTDDLEGRRNSFLDKQKNQPGPVVIDGRELFVITQSFGTQSIGDRIEIITERIINVAKEPSYAIEDVQYESVSASAQSNTTEEGDGEPKQFHGIKLKDLELLAISKADAQALNTTQDILGQEYLQIIRHTIQLYRQERSQEYLTDAAVKTLLSTGLFLISFILTALFFRGLRKSIYKKKKVVKRQGRQSSQKVRLLSYQQILSTGIRVLNFFNVVLNLIFVYFYFAYTLELYPWTRQFSRKLWDYFLYTLDFSWSAFVDYLPNLLILALIFTIARYFLSVTKSICNNLGNGNIAFSGFYPEWATPTYRLLEILIFALVTVISFPYLPGFGSPAFQGVSLFLGG